MAKRRLKIETLTEEQDTSAYELDLSPMLALMVTLIPIMLLATVFVKVTVIESSLPQVVEKAIQEDRNKKKRDVSIQLVMNDNKTFNVSVTVDGRKSRSNNIQPTKGTWDYANLHKKLVSIKQQYPRTFRVDFQPSESVPYEEVVKAIDEARSTKTDDPKLYITDKDTNKKVETDVMFPDVIFSNVVGG